MAASDASETSGPDDKDVTSDKSAVQALVAACIEALERGEKDPASRVCAERPELLTRVQRRLAQLASRGLIPDSEALPAAIGPYRILRELGSGGMGSVYLAEQLHPIRRQAALKVIKLGMDTREVMSRFQGERQALAVMSHPHIAQVFDAGITAEGRPYFVMEYVAGKSLTTFCDAHGLDTRQRVQLMATVCRAVQHAHDRGFIHRDLKPSNVLVTMEDGRAVPKVIDFGIAKATSGADGAATVPASLRTRADQVLGTPEYMSPEQMSSGGIDVDTRTDVYSLGVTLYEMLCGELPFDSKRLRRADRNELERILHDELPTQPSKRLSQVAGAVVAARGGDRTVVQRQVAGELDWITLKAIGKQRELRYESALAMAQDLERWLAHQPVLAAPPGRTYRLRKFVRRHRLQLSAAALVLLSLVVGLVVSLRATAAANEALADAVAAREQESRARSEERAFYGLARDAVGNLVDVADQQLVEVPQAEAARRVMLAKAISFYEALRQRKTDDVELRGDLVDATTRIGQLQTRLGHADDAIATLQRSVQDAEALVAAAPHARRPLELATMAHNALGGALTTSGRGRDARQSYERALELLAQARPLPDGASPQRDVLEAQLSANVAMEIDDPREGVAAYERALAAFARIGTPDASVLRDQTRCLVSYAEALTRNPDRQQDAARVIEDATRQLEQLPAGGTVRARETTAHLYGRLAATQQRLGQRGDARQAKQKAIAIYEQLAAEHPDVPSHLDNAAGGWHVLADLAEDDAQLQEAQHAITRAAEMRAELHRREPRNHRFAMRYVRTLMSKADNELQAWQRENGDPNAAKTTLQLAASIVDPLAKSHGDDVDVVLTYCGVHAALGLVAVTEARYGDAVREHEAVRDTATAQLKQHGSNPDLHYQLATAACNLLQAHLLGGDIEAALAAGTAGMPHIERGLALDARHRALRDLAATLFGRVSTVRMNSGDHEGGIELLQEMVRRTDLGDDCREQGCLLLCNSLEHDPQHPKFELWRRQMVEDLRTIVRARGGVAEALQRPAQAAGFSHWRSRLRDLDLRLALGEALGRLDERAEQAEWLVEAVAIADSLPRLSGDRLRNMTSQRTEVALTTKNPKEAIATVEAFLQRSGERGGGHYLAACLYLQARELVDDADERERLAGCIVQQLKLALDHREVPAGAVQHANFDFLRGRTEFDELRRR